MIIQLTKRYDVYKYYIYCNYTLQCNTGVGFYLIDFLLPFTMLYMLHAMTRATTAAFYYYIIICIFYDHMNDVLLDVLRGWVQRQVTNAN